MMKKIFFIYFEIDNNTLSYEKFIERVTNNCARKFLDGRNIIFAMAYDMTADKLRSTLFKNTDEERYSIIIDITNSAYAGYLPKNIWDWLKDKQGVIKMDTESVK